MKKLSLLPILLLLINCNNKSNETHSPYLNFEVGFEQILVNSTKTVSNQMGSFNEINETKYVLDSISVDSTYHFTGKTIRVKYASDIFGERESFDTNNMKDINQMTSDELELYNEVKATLNNPFTFEIDRNGKMITTPKFKDLSYSYLNSDIEQRTISPVIFPNEGLYVGYQWTQKTTNPLIKSQNINFTYTVENITKDHIILDVEMVMDGIGSVLDNNKAKGTYKIDKKTKTFLEGERVMKMQTGGGKAIYKIYGK